MDPLSLHGANNSFPKHLEENLSSLKAFIRMRMGRLREKESASDVVQSVCREILERPEWYRNATNGKEFKQRLFTAAERAVVDHARYWQADKRNRDRQAQAPAASGDEAAAGAQQLKSFRTPSQAAVTSEEMKRIERALDRLPQDQREVILLSRIAKLSRKEIADRMERSEASVRSLLSRALARLSGLLD